MYEDPLKRYVEWSSSIHAVIIKFSMVHLIAEHMTLTAKSDTGLLPQTTHLY